MRVALLVPKYGNTKQARSFILRLYKVPTDWKDWERSYKRRDILISLQREKYVKRKRGR